MRSIRSSIRFFTNGSLQKNIIIVKLNLAIAIQYVYCALSSTETEGLINITCMRPDNVHIGEIERETEETLPLFV